MIKRLENQQKTLYVRISTVSRDSARLIVAPSACLDQCRGGNLYVFQSFAICWYRRDRFFDVV